MDNKDSRKEFFELLSNATDTKLAKKSSVINSRSTKIPKKTSSIAKRKRPN